MPDRSDLDLEPEFQIVVILNFPERKDKEIIINGPFKAYDIIDAVDRLLKEPRWTKVVSNKEPAFFESPVQIVGERTRALLFYGIFAHQLERIKNSVLQKTHRPAQLTGMRLAREAFVWLFEGNVSGMSQTTLIRGI